MMLHRFFLLSGGCLLTAGYGVAEEAAIDVASQKMASEFAEETVTYMGKIFDITNFIDYGTIGYFFTQFNPNDNRE